MFDLPPKLKWLEKSAAGREWLRQLPAHVQAGVDRWSLRLEPPYESSCGFRWQARRYHAPC
jgi:streptomycin 6-kinase